MSLEELSRQHGFSKAIYYKWRAQYGGMDVSALKRLKELEDERPAPQKLIQLLSLDWQMETGQNAEKTFHHRNDHQQIERSGSAFQPG